MLSLYKVLTPLLLIIFLVNSSELSAKNYAVLISVGDYKNHPDIAYANSDAALMGLTLLSHRLGPIEEEDIFNLYNENATSDNIAIVLSHLSRILVASDQLVIYYSGHGYFGGLHTYDYNENDTFSYQDLRYYLRNTKCRDKIIILDTCYSGSLFLHSEEDVKQLEQYFSNNRKKKYSNTNTIVIMSSRLDQSSYETPHLGHGLFTYFLCKGLNGSSDINEDNKISIEELYYYTRDNVYLYMKGNTSKNQCPTLMGNYQNNYIISKK